VAKSTPALSRWIAVVCRLCRRRHRRHWIKPLRGSDSRKGPVRLPSLPVFTMKFDCDTLMALLAAPSYRKGASHDCSSTTDDRGRAGAGSVAAYPGIVSPTSFAIGTVLSYVAGYSDPSVWTISLRLLLSTTGSALRALRWARTLILSGLSCSAALGPSLSTAATSQIPPA
jgi:hypothetical protein